MVAPWLTCTGRAFDALTAQPLPDPAGQPCGNTFARQRYERQARYELRARMQGWRLGPADTTPRHVMCRTCSRPDATTAGLCRDLDRSTKR